jgi:hypothetical protein
LAGGLSAYGFANGDPINYDDPFGLCPPGQTEVSALGGECVQAFYPGALFLSAEGVIADAEGGIAAAYKALRGLSGLAKATTRAEGTGNATGVNVGTKVARVFGGKSPQMGESWTTVDPKATPDYAAVAGLPNENAATHVVYGEITDMTGVRVTKATPGARGPGGISEVKIPNATTQVKVTGVQPFNQ